jgi:hypothetical protein
MTAVAVRVEKRLNGVGEATLRIATGRSGCVHRHRDTRQRHERSQNETAELQGSAHVSIE